MHPRTERTSPIFEELEPRLLFSAGLDIVFIDGALEDADTLARAAEHADFVRIYDSTSESAADLLGQAAAHAQSAGQPIESLSILAHGSTDGFMFGSDTVTNASLVTAADVWTSFGGSLASGANIYLFGCDVAADPVQATSLLDTLAGLTGADVFASSDLTGRGGDWELEAASSGAFDELTAGLPLPFDPDVLAGFSGVLANVAPTVTMPGAALSYTENTYSMMLDLNATVSDPDSPNFASGTLTVQLTANGTAPDKLQIRHQGTYSGAIGVSGNTVLYSNVAIGTFTGGTDGFTPLVVTFNAAATPASVQALLRDISYSNLSNDPSAATRTVQIVLTDGDGGTSSPVTKTIDVIPVNDAPRVLNQALTLDENATAGTVLGTVPGINPEAAETLTYSIIGGNADNAFSIDPVTGTITVNAGAAIDYEAYGSATSPSFVLQSGAANPLDGQVIGANITPALVDIDGDGDQDLFAGAIDGAIRYFENVGTPTDPSYVQRFGANNPLKVDVGDRSVPTFVDIDADGDYDAFIGEWFGGIRFYENTGSADAPTFVARTGAANPFNGVDIGWQPGPVFGDIDGDGDFDAFVGDKYGSIHYFENTGDAGSPVLTHRTGANNPLSAVHGPANLKPALVDIDGDGDLDVFLGNNNYYSSTAPYYENVGSAASPAFVQRTGDANPLDGLVPSAYSTLTFADLDGDGDFDVLAGSQYGTVDFLRNEPAIGLRVQAQDNGPGNLTGSGVVSIVLVDINESPLIADQSLSVPENSAVGTAVGTVLAADPDRGDVLTYSIVSGNADGAFAIDAASGAITVNNAAALDHENRPQYTLGIEVLDSGALTASAQLTIAVTDVNEAPVVADHAFEIDENTVAGTQIGTVLAGDPDVADVLTYSIVAGNTDDAFTIDAASGVLRVNDAAALDFERNPQFTLTVRVQDGGALASSATVTIGLRNVNEAPQLGAQIFQLDENSPAGFAIGTVAAADPDQGDALRYSIVAGNDAGAFALDPTTGALTVNDPAALDFEANSEFRLGVRVDDLFGAGATADVVVRLADVNETPVMTDRTLPFVGKFADGAVLATLTASDPDAGDTLCYAIVGGNERGGFALDPDTGVLTLIDATAVDLDRDPLVVLEVRAQDAAGLGTTCRITVDFRAVAGEAVVALERDTPEEVPPPAPPATVVLTGSDSQAIARAPEQEHEVLGALTTNDDEIVQSHGRGTRSADTAHDDGANVADGEQAPPTAAGDQTASGPGSEGGATTPETPLPPTEAMLAQELRVPDVDTQVGSVPNTAIPGFVEGHRVREAADRSREFTHLPGGAGMRDALDDLGSEISEAAEQVVRQQQFVAQAATGLAVTASASVLGSNLRGGSLLASLASSIPIWKGFDPLPILAMTEDQQRRSNAGARRGNDADDRDAGDVERLLDRKPTARDKTRTNG